MAIQFSVGARNGMLDAIETAGGTTPHLRMYTGSPPADCASAATGTLLVDATLPSDWMAAASSGSKALSGTWQDASADGTGTAGYFRVWDSAVTNCHIQGTITATGGGGDMTLDNTSITAGQTVTVTMFTLTAANA